MQILIKDFFGNDIESYYSIFLPFLNIQIQRYGKYDNLQYK